MILSVWAVFAAVVTATYSADLKTGRASGAKGETIAEGVTGAVTYSPSALFFRFGGTGAPAGSFTVQVRPGARNCATPVSPIAVSFDVKPGAAPVCLLAPSAPSRLTPQVAVSLEVETGPKGGWTATLKLPFGGRLWAWPFAAARKRPATWFATVSHTDGSGRRTDWGTPDDPLQIGWGRAPAYKEVRDVLFSDEAIVSAYVAARGKYADLFDFSQKERWIGYLDPGVETFAWRNAASEKLFHDHYAAPVYEKYDGAKDLLVYRPSRVKGDKSKKPPKVLELAEPARQRAFEMLDGFSFAAEDLAALRKRYLLDRFLARELAEIKPKKTKKTSSAASLRAPDIDSDDTGDLSLDDAELEF